ncbi:TetR/AcrR family transcriptional regulator [Nocardiopsis trehalosi]|jgi:AcrR family transcriptional regulator|uniref:TetR/AcrR family transcriptional regulator n=1 Tax=Nocardiopsis trehalosi TaxID=109329 RepID=UPI0009FBB5EA|nr:TetR/AcrR family transcriptional regulator [Nocardiopsis trehalosi]
MRANSTAGGRSSVVGEVRRRQIVDAAAVALARDGVEGASLARIAAVAGLSSTGMISYHFPGKEAVFASLTERLLRACAADLRAAVDAAPDAPAALNAYIAAFVAFQDAHRDGVSALRRLLARGPTPADAAGPAAGSVAAVLLREAPALAEPLVTLLERGCAEGDFRPVNVRWTARGIQCAVEGFHDLFHADPGIDAAAFTAEVQALYANGLRADAPRGGPVPATTERPMP